MIENWERHQANVESLVQESQADLETDLKFTPEDINTAYMEQPAKFAYWSIVAAQAKAAYDKKKLEVERQEDYMKKMLISELDKIVRHKLEDQGKRITEAMVSSNIYTHPFYAEEQQKLYALQDELLELQRQCSLLYAAKDAMIHRKDMLVSMGAQLRQESNQ